MARSRQPSPANGLERWKLVSNILTTVTGLGLIVFQTIWSVVGSHPAIPILVGASLALIGVAPGWRIIDTLRK